MTRRSNGEGSFYQQKDKSWVYQITYGRKADGSPYRKSFKGRTKTICKAHIPDAGEGLLSSLSKDR